MTHPLDIPVAPVKGARVVFKGCLAGEAVAPPKKKAAKKKPAKSHKPYPCGPDHGHFGRKLSPEHRAKVAAANAARWAAMTPEQRRARNARQIAVLHSAEVKENAAAAIRARYATPELREQHAALIRAGLPRKVNAPPTALAALPPLTRAEPPCGVAAGGAPVNAAAGHGYPEGRQPAPRPRGAVRDDHAAAPNARRAA